MGRSVAALQSEMDSAEFSEWMSYAEQFGLPDPFEQTALLCSVIANANGNKTKPADFLPRGATVEQPLEAVEQKLKAMANGKTR